MAPKRQLDFHPQLPVQRAKLETHLDVGLMASLQENPLAEAMRLVWQLVRRLAPAMWQPGPVMLGQEFPGKAILPVAAD